MRAEAQEMCVCVCSGVHVMIMTRTSPSHEPMNFFRKPDGNSPKNSMAQAHWPSNCLCLHKRE